MTSDDLPHQVLHELHLLDAAAEAGTRSTSDGGVAGEGGGACATPSMLPPPLPWRHPILIVGPRAVGAYLAAHTALLPPAERPRFHFETCAAFNAPRSVGRARLLRVGAQHGALGLAAVRCVPVVHCADAWGVVLSSHDGWTLVYSGDTRPCEALVAAGQVPLIVGPSPSPSMQVLSTAPSLPTPHRARRSSSTRPPSMTTLSTTHAPSATVRARRRSTWRVGWGRTAQS